MANEFDLEQLIDKVNKENGLNKKLSAFDGEEQEQPAVTETATCKTKTAKTQRIRIRR